MVYRPDRVFCRCDYRSCIKTYVDNYAICSNIRLDNENAELLADLSYSDIKVFADPARNHDNHEREAFRKADEIIGFGLGVNVTLFDSVLLTFIGIGVTAFDIIKSHVRGSHRQDGRHHAL